MASSSATPQGADIPALKKELYDYCMPLQQEGDYDVFHQQDLMSFDIIPGQDLTTLLMVVQALVNEKLFKIVTSADGVGWRCRTQDEARKYRTLTAEQELVYAHIDEAGEDGLWSKTIKTKSNLHDAVFNAAIKHLESKAMISTMKSVEHPTRKMYIKSSLQPSDRATGGPWFTDGELDEEFIDMAMKMLYEKIQKLSFYLSHRTKQPKKHVDRRRTIDEVKAARRAGLGAREDDDGGEKARKRDEYNRYLPMPAGYQGYPTLHELTLFIENGNAFQNVTLSQSDVKQLLDIMCFDGKIQQVVSGSENISYKALRQSLVDEDEKGSVLTEAPCGRCPVFDLCEEGGPVGPSNCEYFDDWLNL